jgi:cobyrinic acid a,c-diamide synthase
MRVVLGGVSSGVGKTTLTAGLIAALRRRDLTVQPFKVGPDYIDSSYHTLAAARPCRNLDSWMLPPDRLAALFTQYARLADIAVIEGVMGVFDGLDYTQEIGSTAHVAKVTRTPLVLIVDASQMARSAGAVALGFKHYDPALPLAGFLVNNVGGPAHGEGVATAIEQATQLPVLGSLPHFAGLEIPERHLGLVPTAEPGRWRDFIQAAADHVARYVDLDRLLAVAQGAPPLPAGLPLAGLTPASGPAAGARPVVAVARDEAFSFIYEENLDLLRAAGAEIAFFSPLADPELPRGTQGVILCGGFPELYAERLAANGALGQALRSAHAQGMPIYAECGGLMTLTEAIVDLDGRAHRLFGLLPGRTVMTPTLSLGYRRAEAASDSWLLHRGEEVRGHEFHYSRWDNPRTDLAPAYRLLPLNGHGPTLPEGVCLGSLWASYVHLPFWAKPELAQRFVDCCAGWTAGAA